MSGECTVTPGYTWPDGDKIQLTKLRQTAQPAVQINEAAVGGRELDTDALFNIIGDSVSNQNYLAHGNFEEPSWRRGTGPATAVAGVETRLHEDWFVAPSGAAVTQERSTVVPIANKLSLHSLKVTGATSVTTVDIGQDIPRHISAALRGSLAIAAWLYNGTGADFAPRLRLDTANAANNFTGVTNRSETVLASCANAQWTLVSAVVDATSFTDMTNGVRLVLRIPGGNLNAGAKSVTLAQVKLERGISPTPFVPPVDPDPLLIPQKNQFSNGNFPAIAWLNGGAPQSSPAGSDTELCTDWVVRPSGAAITQERSDLAPDALSLHSLKLTGAASVTTVNVAQNILRYLTAELRQELTFSCYVRNSTSGAFQPVLIVSTADAADDFSAFAARLTQSLDSCPVAAWTRVQYTFDPAGFTNIENGMRVTLQIPAGVLVASQEVYLAQMKLELGDDRTALLPERLPVIPRRLGVRWTTRALKITNNAGTPNTQVDVTAAEVMLNTPDLEQIFAASVARTADIAASGANGLDTGAKTNSTWYYLWIISNRLTTAALLSLSATAPTMPTGYTYRALVGAVRVDGSGNLVKFWQAGNVCHVAAQVIFNNKNGVTSYTALGGTDLTAMQAAVPPIAVRVMGNIGSVAGVSRGMAVAGDGNGVGEQLVGRGGGSSIQSFSSAGVYRIPLITAQQIHWQGEDTSGSYRLTVTGYEL